jgi:hypothetical protein
MENGGRLTAFWNMGRGQRRTGELLYAGPKKTARGTIQQLDHE